MRIGVITHWWCFENYGQLLQCYAFQRLLKLRGHEPFLIRYCPGSAFGDRMTLARMFRKLKSIPGFLRSIKSRVDGTKRRIAMRRAIVEPARDFNGFRQNYLTMTQDIYRSYAEIQHAKEVDADLYSVGSDVVWGMLPLNNDGRVFFLDFGRKAAKRIAYSPSFGSKEKSVEYKKFAASLIRKLDAVSVRETSGVALCSEMGRHDVVCVMDPVYLLTADEWRSAFNIPEERSGAFGYFLSSKTKLPFDEIRNASQNRGHDFQVTTVYGDLGLDSNLLVNLTIPEWIRRVGSAKIFFTNSFHGISMAIILHTPFVAFLKDGGAGMDNRITTILNRMGLSSRICDGATNSVERIINSEIDWRDVDRRLEGEKKISIDFLCNAGI